VGGLPEYVEEGVTGWLNHSRGPDELAATMQRLAEHPDEVLDVQRRLLERRSWLLDAPIEQVAELERIFEQLAPARA
jgi:glycosyltransferase involved in cell wall biosynthesis